MKLIDSKIYRILLSCLKMTSAAAMMISSLAAQDKTQYLLHEIPQTISLNPAINYNCKNYIELPLLSQIQLSYRNSGFSHKQVILTGEGISGENGSRLNLDGLSNALGNRNHIRLTGKVGLLGLGIEYRDWFFSFNISNRSALRLSFNRSVIDARDGNWDIANNSPQDINISGTGLHFINFTEFAFGAGKEIFPGLSAGFRAKYLLGSAHLQTRRSNISILTTDSPIVLTGTSDLLIRGSLPVNINVNNDGYITSIENNIHSASMLNDFFFAGNHGFAMDAGIIYTFRDDLIFSASILDLGFIRWRKNPSVVSQKEDFVFQGIDLNNFIQTESETNFLEALRDSVNDAFRLSGSGNPYSAMVPLRLLSGVEYKWNSMISFGTILEGEILSGRIYPSLTLTAIARPVELLTLSLSYSLMDRSYSNLGFGIVAGNGPVQFYLVSDNIPVNYVRDADSGIYWPYSARTMNIRAGLNIIIGCRDRETNYRRMRWRTSCPAYR